MDTLVARRGPGVLSGFTLKWIAVASMVIDHLGSIVMGGLLSPYFTDGYLLFTDDMPFLVLHAFQIKAVCEVLGRLAFPLFCFLIAEGFLHTKNQGKYALRLGLFALLSEIPFNLAHYQSLFGPQLQNVMFTLCVSALTLLALARVEARWSGRRAAWVALSAAAVLGGMALALLLRGEYVFLGVLSVSLFYLLRRRPLLRPLGVAPLLAVSPWVLLSLPPLLLYSGKRGRGSKWFFYLFYPAHFLLFAGAAWLLAHP